MNNVWNVKSRKKLELQTLTNERVYCGWRRRGELWVALRKLEKKKQKIFHKENQQDQKNPEYWKENKKDGFNLHGICIFVWVSSGKMGSLKVFFPFSFSLVWKNFCLRFCYTFLFCFSLTKIIYFMNIY